MTNTHAISFFELLAILIVFKNSLFVVAYVS